MRRDNETITRSTRVLGSLVAWNICLQLFIVAFPVPVPAAAVQASTIGTFPVLAERPIGRPYGVSLHWPTSE
ncbi:MAG: hypothetical protein GYA24_06080, partial [Candidatus Lokiarchaeota archaeon]|nr:hypothetical protein [Candidatus Lokiarchaeota archaeon]